MKTRNLIYLAQLEEYDINRIKLWLKNNPKKTVEEIKHHLIWTPKTIFIYIKTVFLSLFMKNERALLFVLRLLTPFDTLIKKIIVSLATIKYKLCNHNTLTIGITGSWGKTTVKETLYSILKQNPNVVLTPSNHNTLLAIAKQALFLSPKTKIFICEIGAYQLGDIKKVSEIIRPKIGIFTALGPMHLERFGSLDNILKTKMELAESLPNTGLFFAPQNLLSKIKTFSLPKNVNYFKNYQEIYYFLGHQFNISKSDIDNTLKSLPPVEHRRQIIKNGPITIIDDAYNSNPAGFRLALDTLKNIQSDTKILITPGMIEMGSLQFEENQKAASYAASICDHIIIVGQTNQKALTKGTQEAKTKVKIHPVPNLKSANELLPSIMSKNSAILYENDLSDQYF